MSMTYGIFLFDDFEELDAIGPWEVFGVTCQFKPDDKLIAITRDGKPVRARKGLKITPDHSFDDCPKLDVLLVPGGTGTQAIAKDQEILNWIAARDKEVTWITSVCTGAYLMVNSGVGKGKRVTTHWSVIDDLRSRGKAEVLSGPRYVRDGNLVTAAGVSAGIDMSLWLIGQIYDANLSREVQREMEYNPAPPYAAEV